MLFFTSRRTAAYISSSPISRFVNATVLTAPLRAHHYHLNKPLHPRQTFATMASAATIYDFKPLDSKGEEYPLSDLKGKVIFIVNVASKCGFTKQYAGLESVYKSVTAKHPDQFVILGFPCNQFGGQEPGTEAEIVEFCQLTYGVSFPIMQKIEVNGDNAHPLYKWLKEQQAGLLGFKLIKWNFEKFLIGKDGNVKGRWSSMTTPENLEKDILAELEK
ncbi:putative glutathione peroxidase [Triangularia verruculosa]|uniref:Glutathione peroxidase n=1 Tax=Triangularia verruculosa TaxID=2587418 RepID=A0AAN6XBA3_9PEZI|nr:putative glutathione peroxidase [Triangularia verruculosa]